MHRSVSLNDCRTTHAAAYAQSRKTLLGVSLLHLIEKGDKNTCAGAAHRMSECDGAAVDVELVHIKAKIVSHCYGLSRKGLVCLDQVEIADRVTALLHSLAGSRYRADAHDAGLYACRRCP